MTRCMRPAVTNTVLETGTMLLICYGEATTAIDLVVACAHVVESSNRSELAYPSIQETTS